MKPEDLYQYSEFLEYAKSRRLSASLIDACLTTLVRSHIAGDGSLFTDSILNTVLEQQTSNIASCLSSFIGTRGSIITEITKDTSFTSQILVEGFEFQSPIDKAIREYISDNPNEEIGEDTLFVIELEEAIESYGHTHANLAMYIEELLFPLIDREQKMIKIKGAGYSIDKFRNYFIDAFTLSIMLNIHPFDIFKSKTTKLESLDELKFKYIKNYKREMLTFLLYLRDCARVSPEYVPDEVLKEIIDKWQDDHFVAAIDDIEVLDDETNRYFSACYFAAHKLQYHEIPIVFLLDKLHYAKSHENYPIWNENEALLIYLDSTGKVNVDPADILGIQKFSHPLESKIEIVKASCGLIIPNPIWNESVIDRLEFLINKRDVKEFELDLFFQMYPTFVLDDLHCSAIPQVILLKETGTHLRPDFLIQRTESKFIDIVEIKRPLKKLVSGTIERPFLTREFARALAQLKEYRDWFRNESNRIWFRRKYGLEGYEPALTLIIGRSLAFKSEVVRKKILEGSGVNIITYDDLVRIARRRRELVPEFCT